MPLPRLSWQRVEKLDHDRDQNAVATNSGLGEQARRGNPKGHAENSRDSGVREQAVPAAQQMARAIGGLDTADYARQGFPSSSHASAGPVGA